ncbi:MAG: hypothetical protein NVS3B28_22000 [Candidatus Velthaea sp.]
MDRSLDVRTGESVAIRYELAGLGSRFLAVFIDVAIQLGVTLGIFLVFLLMGSQGGNLAHYIPLPQKTAQAVVIAAIVTLAFVVFFGYFIIFELWWSGRTPGKRAVGIRVVRDAGFPIDAGASVIRNLVRVLELGFGFYAVSAIVALISRENKRLGDFAAGTIVVRERSYERAGLDAFDVVRRADDDGLAAADREVIERFMARRSQLEPAARLTLAAQIAARVRPQLRADFSHLDDDALVEHLGRGAVTR